MHEIQSQQSLLYVAHARGRGRQQQEAGSDYLSTNVHVCVCVIKCSPPTLTHAQRVFVLNGYNYPNPNAGELDKYSVINTCMRVRVCVCVQMLCYAVIFW